MGINNRSNLMNLVVKANYQDLSAEAAGIVAQAIRANPRINVCLATGQTPVGMFRELVRLHREAGLDFRNVGMFHLDEYLDLSPEHPGTFRSCLQKELFEPIGLPPENAHFISEDYESVIQEAGGIDILIAGLGRNGHIAFNEPGSAFSSRTRRVRLADSTIEGIRLSFPPSEVPREALTVGLATIMEARRILLLVSGTEKASVLARVLTGPIDVETPASILRMHPNATALADREAVSPTIVTPNGPSSS